MRSFVCAQLFSQDVLGLVDAGAPVSCFASGYAKRFVQENTRWKKFTVFLKRADVSKQAAIGCIATDVSVRDKTNLITFLTIPSLQQNLYLGGDFMRNFGLAKDLFGEISIHLRFMHIAT